MISKNDLHAKSEEISDLFDEKKYFGNVHSLETADEGLCSLFYIELKPPFPSSKELQFAFLWRLIEEYEYSDYYNEQLEREAQNNLFHTFQEFISEWNPRAITDKDQSRIRKTILECQSSFPDGSIRESWGNRRQVGYYKNNKFKGSQFPKEIENKILTSNSGMVVSDDWNGFMVLTESKNVLSMFYWFTGV